MERGVISLADKSERIWKDPESIATREYGVGGMGIPKLSKNEKMGEIFHAELLRNGIVLWVEPCERLNGCKTRGVVES